MEDVALVDVECHERLILAALKFGAGRCVGVEIDEEALRTSRVNAKANGFESDSFEAMLPEEEEAASKGEGYPLVVANILAHTGRWHARSVTNSFVYHRGRCCLLCKPPCQISVHHRVRELY